MRNLQGKLLVAIPQLPDPNFFRSVILILQHNEEGALGVVLNRPTRLTVQNLWKRVFDSTIDDESTVFLGGPVDGPLIAVHDYPQWGDLAVAEGLFYTMTISSLKELSQTGCPRRKLFIGHSGWAPSQLEHELDAGGWLVCDCRTELVFGECERLWQSVCEEYGREILIAKHSEANAPHDPSLN